MKFPTIDCARLVRDAGIDAMDALNTALVEATPHLSVSDERDLRHAIATTMSVILDNVVNPVLRAYPELDVDEDSWGDIAMEKARRRATGASSTGSGQP